MQIPVEEWRAGLWLHCLEQQGISDDKLALALAACFAKTRLLHYEFIPGVPQLVTNLRKVHGLKCVLITNGHIEVQKSKIAACTAHKLFDHILIGGEEEKRGGNQKPHKSIFERACTLARCLPSEAIMVGDSLTADIQGGINCNLKATVWINAHNQRLSKGMPQPNFIVKSVLELPSVIEQLDRWSEATTPKAAGSDDRFTDSEVLIKTPDSSQEKLSIKPIESYGLSEKDQSQHMQTGATVKTSSAASSRGGISVYVTTAAFCALSGVCAYFAADK